MKKESMLYPYGELDVLNYYSCVAPYLKDFLKGKEIEMKKGVIIYMDKNAVHSLTAKTNLSFLLTLH